MTQAAEAEAKPVKRRRARRKASPDAVAAPAPTIQDTAIQDPTIQDPAAQDPAAAGFAPIVTERLTLRPLQPKDAESLHRLINDWEVTRTLAVVPFPYQREDADAWIVSATREIEEGTAYHLAITGQEGAEEMLIGAVGLHVDRATRVGRLGYWVGRRFWGHGVATEAAGRLVRWGLANLELDRITADVATDNPASAEVLRRIGFSQTGEGVGHSVARGGNHPVWKFETTREAVFGQTEVAATGTGEKPLLLVAACALIDTDGRVLLARRPEGKKMAGLWEFPGGKLNPGETPEAALIRELKEELGIDVSAACLAPFAFASHAYDRFHLLMPLYLCRRWKGVMTAREGQALAWVRPQKLTEYEMPPADKPLIPLLRDFL
ncbi:MAG: 8-oxo-dGTP diphosphatase MutT [Acetobacteraceae bacterium]|nr:8-oxo-dGTP diphosphatase MutT [Acetobacteraceae bacterium]